jgi:hypothetical protein
METMTLAAYDEATVQNIGYWKDRLADSGHQNSLLKDQVAALKSELARAGKRIDELSDTLKYEREAMVTVRLLAERMGE